MSTDASPVPGPSAKPLPPFFASDRVWGASVLGVCIIIASLIWTFGSRVGRYQMVGNLRGNYIVDTATGDARQR